MKKIITTALATFYIWITFILTITVMVLVFNMYPTINEAYINFFGGEVETDYMMIIIKLIILFPFIFIGLIIFSNIEEKLNE